MQPHIATLCTKIGRSTFTGVHGGVKQTLATLITSGDVGPQLLMLLWSSLVVLKLGTVREGNGSISATDGCLLVCSIVSAGGELRSDECCRGRLAELRGASSRSASGEVGFVGGWHEKLAES